MPSTPDPRDIPIPLRDGTSLSIHPLGAEDAELMSGFLEALTPEDRRRRFFQAVPVVTPLLLRPLVEVDQIDHVAWIGLVGSTPVVEARFVRLSSDRSTAELAFAVHPGWRRRGLAATAVRALGVVASAQGVTTFVADAMPDNLGSVAVFRSLGMSSGFEDGLVTARGPVPEWTGDRAVADDLLSLHGLCPAVPAA